MEAEPLPVDPHAIRVMIEIGIDISRQRSKSIEEFRETEFDYVVTICDHARESCPFFPRARTHLHRSFDDPSQFTGTDDEALSKFRRIRDQIRSWIEETFGRELEASD